MRQAYTSTVVGPVPLGLGMVSAVAAAIIAAAARSPVWLAAVFVIVVLLAAADQSTVRLSVGGGRLVLGHGPWNRRVRTLPADEVVAADSTNLRWPQVFGIGVRFHRKTTRLTARPGPTLHLELRTGEHIRISTPDPDAARTLLIPTEQEAS